MDVKIIKNLITGCSWRWDSERIIKYSRRKGKLNVGCVVDDYKEW